MSSDELRAFVESDDNIIAVYTDRDGVTVILVLDDEPEKMSRYTMRGEEVKIIKSPPIIAYQNHEIKYRPTPAGVSTGHYRVTAGTLSLVVRDKISGKTSVLSNNHIYGNMDTANPGDALLQPGVADGGKSPADMFARFTRLIPLRVSTTKYADAAIGEVINPADVSLNVLEIGYCYGISDPYVDELIWKSGRTTERSKGKVIAADASVKVDYGGFQITLQDCIVSTIASAPGDSGSPLLDFSSNYLVGLLFAGNGEITIGCKSKYIFRNVDKGGLEIETIKPPEIMRSLWLDLSHWQEPINSLDEPIENNFKFNVLGLTPHSFSQMKTMGVRGVIIKICQGNDIIDPQFEKYYDMARSAGLLVGGYIFVDPEYSYTAHYNNFLKAVGDRKFDIPPALDCESGRGKDKQIITSCIYGLSKSISEWCGRLPLIYTSVSFWNDNVLAWSGWKDHPLWIAFWSEYVYTPAVPESWKGVTGQPVMWQHDVCDNGAALGVGSKQVDLNLTFRSFENLLGEPPPVSTSQPPASTSASASPSPSVPPPNEKAVYEHYKGKSTVSLNYRNGPGTTYTYLGTMKVGTEVEILETKLDTANNIWARIGYNQWAAQLYKGQEYIRYILTSD